MTPGDEASDDEAEAGLAVDRRTLLAAGLAGGSLGVAAYLLAEDDDLGDQSPPARQTPTPDASPPAVDDEEPRTIPEDHVPFSIWAEQRDAIRTSPDHLPARAERLAEDGDPEAIFEFVRDEIATVPTTVGGTGVEPDHDLDEWGRWGSRGALRSGTGTPRDKADLLASLLRDAGYETAVRSYVFDQAEQGLDADGVRDHYLRSVENEYAPDVDDATLEDWAERAEGIDPSAALEAPDDDHGDAQDLAGDLREVLPDDPADADGGPDAFDWRWDVDYRRSGRTPVVEFDDDGEARYGNLFGDVPFGELGPGGFLEDAPDPGSRTLSVTLSAVTAADVGLMSVDDRDPMELVSGEWAVPDLVGRQVLVRTPPTQDPFEYPELSFADVSTYVPSLAVQSPSTDEAEMADHSAFGDAVTVTGDRLAVDHAVEDGELVVDDETPIRNGNARFEFDDDADPDAVTDLQLTVDASKYPTVRLGATATDADGETLGGLSGSAFAATDEDERVVPELVGNAFAPRVLLVRDTSSSMEKEAIDGAADDETYETLRRILRETAPEATVDTREVDSNIWTHLVEAVADRPDLVVYVHDGISEDSYAEWMEPVLADAPSTVLVSAVDEDAPVEDEFVREQAERTDGRVAPLGDLDEVRATLEAVLFDTADYQFEYRVPQTAPGRRTVELSVGSAPEDSPATTATATYDVTQNDTATASPSTGLVGLYLTVEVDDRSVTRTLAGWGPTSDGSLDFDGAIATDGVPDRATLEDHARDVHGALNGGVTLSFEGDGLPYGVAIDEFLAGLNTREHLEEAAVEGDYEDQVDAWRSGFVEVPWELFELQAHLPNAVSEDGLTFFDGPRVAMSRVKPDLYAEELTVERTLDVLPLSRAATVVDGPDERFFRTLERTADVAITEAELLETSTADLLDGIELTRLGDLSAEDVGEERLDAYHALRERAGVSADDYQLVPADGSELAFWNVDRRTGSLLGVIDDGSGGARTVHRTSVAVDRHWDTASEVAGEIIDLLEEKGAISGMGATSLGVLADYYAELAKLYGQVTVILAAAGEGARETRQVDNDVREDLEDMIADLAKSAAEGWYNELTPG